MRVAGAGRTLDLNVEPRRRDAVKHAPPPLDDDDATRKVNVEVVELERAGEPVGVDVHEWRSVDQARVCAGEDKGRTGNRSAHSKTFTDAAGECGLACTERAGQNEKVARAKPSAQFHTEVMHRVGRCDRRVEGDLDHDADR
jgi:hypothetical protein